jgi:hypothetical protein
VRSYFVADLLVSETDRNVSPGLAVASGTSLMSSAGGLALVRDRRVRSGDPEAVAALKEALDQRQTFGAGNGWSRIARYGYPSPGGSHTLGFAWERNGHQSSFAMPSGGTITLDASNDVLVVPYWFLTSLAAWSLVPVTLALRRGWQRRRSARDNRCRSCGYDLRATPGRCPECGTEAVHAA